MDVACWIVGLLVGLFLIGCLLIGIRLGRILWSNKVDKFIKSEKKTSKEDKNDKAN